MDKQKKYIISAIIVASLLLPGCGDMKTNPVEDYPELSNSVAPHGEKPRSQDVRSPQFATLDVLDVNGGDANLVFIEGQSATYYLAPRLFPDGVQFVLQLDSAPPDVSTWFTLEKAADPQKVGMYALTWHPPYGVLGDSLQSRLFDLPIRIVVQSTTDPKLAEIMNSVADPLLPVILHGSDEIPLIESVRAGGKVVSMQESISVSPGKTLEVLVDVKDVRATKERAPRIIILKGQGSGEGGDRVDGSALATVKGEPEVLDNGSFRFKVSFDAGRLEGAKGAKGTRARFQIMALSTAVQQYSPLREIEVEVSNK